MSVETGGLVLRAHARRRGAQRSVSEQQMRTVVQYGRRFHAAGMVHYFFGEREAAENQQLLGEDVWELNGVVVVVSYDGQIITTYRNREALAHIKRKPKWRWAPTLA